MVDHYNRASLAPRGRISMQRSTERILTTHTGSLPRPEGLVQLMFAKEEGQRVDAAELAEQVSQAVADIVRRQVEAGVDVVSDGEMSKPGYATYVKDRLTGFEGESQQFRYQDVADFPELNRRVFSDPGRARRKTPACIAPITVRDPQAVQRDIDNLRAATAGAPVREAFMTAASPGVVALFFHNQYYPSREAYLHAIADAQRTEYRAVVDAGFVLQVDCPDLAMGRHIQFADATLDEFRRQARLNVEALNAALAGLPRDRVRLHLCWGNYEGPHHYDVPLRDIIEIAFSAHVGAVSFEAANPRHAHEWQVFRDVAPPPDMLLIPGVIESCTNYIEHPELVAERIVKLAELVGRERVLAGSDCGFGTWVGMARVDRDVVWAKLGSLAEGARLASTRLWA
jgi:5-methyltetrahydropteroyltriglutamate--homocysteine methyltransferase